MNLILKEVFLKRIILMLVVSASLNNAEIPATKIESVDDNQQKDLEYYINYSLEHNPRIKSSRDNVEIKKREAELAASLPDPMVMASTSSSRSFGFAAIGASQMIMWPGKLAAMKKAGDQLTEAKQHTLAATMASVEADVRTSYATLYALGQTIRRLKENLELLRQFEQIAMTQYITSGTVRTYSQSGNGMTASGNSLISNRASPPGMGQMGQSLSTQSGNSSMPSGQMSSTSSMPSGATNQSVLLKIQIEQAMLEDQIRNAEVQADSERKRFKAILGGDDHVTIPFPSKFVSLSIPDSDKQIIEAVKEKNPQIIAMEQEVASASAMVSAARKGFFPDISIGVEYMPSSSSTSSSMSTTSMSKNGGNWDASVSLTVPLWIGKKKKEIERVKKMESSMSNELEDMKNMVIAETEMLLNSIHDAQRRIELYQDVLIPQLKQVVEIHLTCYSTGQSSFLDIIDGQRTLLDLQTKLANEQAGREIAAAGIVRMLGSRQLGSMATTINSSESHQNHLEGK
jgi:outer membrane protein TolC